MLTNNVPDNCQWPEETQRAVCCCELCGGEIYHQDSIRYLGGFWNGMEVCEECYERTETDGRDEDSLEETV